MNLIPKPEFPRPQYQRENWLNLNGEWDFALFPQGQEEKEALFQAEHVYERRIVVPFSWACPLSGVNEDVQGIGWYRKHVSFSSHERIFLCFGAVDYECEVYINKKLAGKHVGGYTYFEFDVTDFWDDADTCIEVRVQDYRLDSQTYGKQGYGDIQGIWQTVWLESRPQQYIRSFKITTKISGEVVICARVEASENVELIAAFGDERVSARVKEGQAILILQYKEPHLWSIHDPFLYEGIISLGKDRVHTYFGIREIGTRCFGDREYPWITLNNQPIYLNGTLDQAFNPEGYFTYPSEDAIYDVVAGAKRVGLNMVRIHIKAEEPRKLYWMDKLGLLVMADIPCFWGEPSEIAKAGYERDWPLQIQRDWNHPSIFSWVMFNETWGLFHKRGEEKIYLPETQKWVESVYRRAKEMDPTRIVEDNSPCLYDHTVTDLNTWHFYINGYEQVREHIRSIVKDAYPGSSNNFIGHYRQPNVPLMNSECGMVWGVDGSAGDSDLAWQYHYMLNEYRLHEKICGFVFTELNDVVNEFNGYYRIDGTAKEFGYDALSSGMTLCDMHAEVFAAVDMPPCQTIDGGMCVEVPVTLSNFGKPQMEGGQLRWILWHEDECRVTDAEGYIDLPAYEYGTTRLPIIRIAMPRERAVAVLSLFLSDACGNVLSRNFVTFDVQASLQKNCIEIPVNQGKCKGFSNVWRSINDDKLCMGQNGQVSYDINLPAVHFIKDMTIRFEASAKRVLTKDTEQGLIQKGEQDFVRGYRVARGSFENSYLMTDESRFPSKVEVLVNGTYIGTIMLENDWADARGVLSWHAQPNVRKLDEAGSYGEYKKVKVPSTMLSTIEKAGGFNLTFRVNDGGLALYGSNCGRYPIGLQVLWN